MTTIRVRFAPSPTGRMHIGNFQRALNNYLFARKNGGVFYVRIEDTDRARFVEGAAEGMLRTLERMGIAHDEGPFLENGAIVERGEYGPYVQSQRLPIYRSHADRLVEEGMSYPCFCSTERLDELRKSQEAAKQPTGYDRKCWNIEKDEALKRIEAGEKHVLRFAMPREGTSEIDDLVRGRVSFENALVDDFVILKTDGFPTYHLAAIVDDHLMKTSHIIRGEEWLSSIPKHVQLFRAFGWELPTFAHLPLLLNADRSKLSKRQGDVAVEDYLDQGYLPEAIVNFVGILGGNPSDTQEIYSMKELEESFDPARMNPSGAVFNREKLDWLNGKYIRALTREELAVRSRPFLEAAGVEVDLPDEELGGLLSLEQERVKTLSELPEAVRFLFAETLEYSKESLVWKKSNAVETAVRLEALESLLGDIDETEWNRKDLEEKVKALISENGWGNGDTLWPLRVALSGREQSPGPFEIAEVLGKMKVLKRLRDAKQRLA